jgi:carbamate kinase
MRLVIALGGNALLRRGEPLTSEVQARNLERAAAALAPLAQAHDLVVTHGNGPQVGLLALQAATDGAPLDLLDAESQGMIGYPLMLALQRHLPGREIVTLLTRVVVAEDDPAFRRPSKPIGPYYDAAQARALRRDCGWQIEARGGQYRRVVASPVPLSVVEAGSIARLLAASVLVIAAGGGGIPVAAAPDGGYRGVEAVVDKDATSALLADALDADALLLLTDVDAVRERWPSDDARRLRRAGPGALAAYHFESGSMAPKVAAATDFVARRGKWAGIGALEDAAEILAGRRGTRIASDAELDFYEA